MKFVSFGWYDAGYKGIIVKVGNQRMGYNTDYQSVQFFQGSQKPDQSLHPRAEVGDIKAQEVFVLGVLDPIKVDRQWNYMLSSEPITESFLSDRVLLVEVPQAKVVVHLDMI